jgi:phenylalanine-4-hydroxylase
LGCSEEELLKLAAIYWFTIEFGICRQDGGLKAYGAGILGGLGELEYCISDKPKFYPLDLDEITRNHLNFVINSMQPYYFVAESFRRAKELVQDYYARMDKPFTAIFDPKTQTIKVDREITMIKEINETGPLF